MLYADDTGTGPRLVLVHGFTQTRRSWDTIALDLEADHEVIAVDAPGHGRSAHVHADLDTGARLVGQVGGHATYVGYSMGARLCLHLALAEPRLVRALVLVGATAGITDANERRQRQLADEALAAELERIGVDAFLEHWLADPLFASLNPVAAGVAARRENTVAGLTASLRLAGTGTQEPLQARLSELAMPVLVVAGEHDTKFAGLAEELVAAIGPNAEVAIISGASHAVHLERPAPFVAAVRKFLKA